MVWKEEIDNVWFCNTPAGELIIYKDADGYSIYLNGKDVGKKDDLETAKSEAKVQLSILYYHLKIYLEL